MKRNRVGTSLLEVVIAGIFLVPFILMLVDGIVLGAALAKNESICREAARQASTSNPRDARAKAESVIKSVSVGGVVSGIELADFSSTIATKDLQSVEPFGGSLRGTVTVRTDVVVHPLVIQWLFKGRTPLKFESVQTFPFTYQMPGPLGAS